MSPRASLGRRVGYTLNELAEVYGCQPATLRQRIARGTLRARKVGRDWVVDEAEAQRLLAARRAQNDHDHEPHPVDFGHICSRCGKELPA